MKNKILLSIITATLAVSLFLNFNFFLKTSIEKIGRLDRISTALPYLKKTESSELPLAKNLAVLEVISSWNDFSFLRTKKAMKAFHSVISEIGDEELKIIEEHNRKVRESMESLPQELANVTKPYKMQVSALSKYPLIVQEVRNEVENSKWGKEWLNDRDRVGGVSSPLEQIQVLKEAVIAVLLRAVLIITFLMMLIVAALGLNHAKNKHFIEKEGLRSSLCSALRHASDTMRKIVKTAALWAGYGAVGGYLCALLVLLILYLLDGLEYAREDLTMKYLAFSALHGIPYGIVAMLIARILFYRLKDDFLERNYLILAIVTISAGVLFEILVPYFGMYWAPLACIASIPIIHLWHKK